MSGSAKPKAPARRRARRARGWLSGSRSTASRRPTPLWQWILAAPILLLLVAGIGIFAYVTLLDPKLGVHIVTAPILERVETRTAGGALDMSGSYLVVRVEATEIKLAPRLPDWNEVAKGDLVAIEVGGTGSAVQAYSWKRAAPGAATPPSPAAPSGASLPATTPAPSSTK